MPYPPELIPRPNYRYLSEIDPVRDRHLLRWSVLPPEEFFDEVNGIPVSVKVIEKIRKNAMDLSTSLLGSFTPNHYRFRVLPAEESRRNYLVFDLWPEGEQITDPIRDEEWTTNEVGTYYYLPIAELHEFEFPFRSGTEEFTARLTVKHTPSRTNFWHYSVRVLDNKNVDIASRYADSPRRGPSNRDDKILKAALKGIRQLIKIGVPDFSPVPKALYQAA